MEDKEECPSSKPVIKKLPKATNPVSPKGMATPSGKVPEAGMRKTAAAASAKESTLGHTKSKTAKAVLAQGQSSEQAARGASLDQATSKETSVGGTAMDQHASAETTKNSPSQNTFKDPVGETEPIQTPLASCADKQTTEASPVQGATAQQSPDQLTESLSTLKLNSAALVNSATPGKRVGE